MGRSRTRMPVARVEERRAGIYAKTVLRAVYLDGDLLLHPHSFSCVPPGSTRLREQLDLDPTSGRRSQCRGGHPRQDGAPVVAANMPVEIRTRSRLEDNHTSAHPDENGPKYVGGPDGTFARQPTISTSSVRGPCTPSTLSSSMSDVADGPETKVMALPSPSTALSRPAKASGTRPTICRSRTTHRW